MSKISYPKSSLTSREFGVLHPRYYHDIVYHLEAGWPDVLDHLFHPSQRIHSYSLPFPLSAKKKGEISGPRAGGMIYQWLAMAEKDLIVDAGSYSYIARTDITNFYGSVYTHCIAWALHGREAALKDKSSCCLLGNKIDRLMQYANDARTIGIPVGPALSDLIAEVILASVDQEVSRRIERRGIDFAAARFKDDYRVLCKSESDGREILLCLSRCLADFNLVLNESKTSVLKLPDGLYRRHDREYFPHRLGRLRQIPFKVFEHTLMIALDIHRRFPGTSILEKFASELLTSKSKRLKIAFGNGETKLKQIKKAVQLLFFAKRESPKLVSHVLGICELLYLDHSSEFPELREFLSEKIEYELDLANDAGSVFEVVWYVFFSRLVGLGITDFAARVTRPEIQQNEFYKAVLMSRQLLFPDSNASLFKKPRDCRGDVLSKQIAAFE